MSVCLSPLMIIFKFIFLYITYIFIIKIMGELDNLPTIEGDMDNVRDSLFNGLDNINNPEIQHTTAITLVRIYKTLAGLYKDKNPKLYEEFMLDVHIFELRSMKYEIKVGLRGIEKEIEDEIKKREKQD